MRGFLSCVLLFLSFSCILENDQSFIPQTKSSFFLIHDLPEGEKHIWQLADSLLLTQAETSFGIEPQNLSDMAGEGDFLWIVEKQGMLHKANLKDGELQSFSIAGVEPAFVACGEFFVVISDTANEQLVFFDKRRETFIQRPLGMKPGKALFRSSKFFLSLDQQLLATYNEQGLSLLDTLRCPFPIIDLQADNRFSIFVHMAAGKDFYLGSIDWNNSQWSLEPAPTSTKIFRATPFFRSSYEKEWLNNVRLDTTARIFLSQEVRGMEIDFLESDAYLHAGNALQRYNMRRRELEELGSLDQKIEGSYFFIDTDD